MWVATLAECARLLVQLKEFQENRLMARRAKHHPHAHDVGVAGVGCYCSCSNTNQL